MVGNGSGQVAHGRFSGTGSSAYRSCKLAIYKNAPLESRHEEVEILVDQEHTLLPIEIKAGQTIAAGFLERFSSLTGNTIETAALVFGGTQGHTRDKISIYP